MATVTSLTQDKIQELMAGWEAVGLSQDQINALLVTMQTDADTQDALLTEFNEVVLPQLRADLAANSIAVSNLNDQLPVLQQQLDAHNLNLQTLNDVRLPSLETSVDNNTTHIQELNDTTLPALDASLATLEGKFPITAPDIAADTITANEIATDAITTNEIAAGAVTANEIAADTITANEIAADTITAAEIAADTITADEIAADTITANEIAADTITSNEIAADAITTNELAADAVTANELAAGAVTAEAIAAGAVTADKLEAALALLGSILVGNNIRINPTEGIVVESPGGTTKLAADGSGNSFKGQGTFDALQVNDNFGMYGTENFLSGKLALNKGVTNPTGLAVVTTSYDNYPMDGARLNPRGLTSDLAGSAWVITDNLSGSTSNYQYWDKVTGLGAGSVNLPAGWEAWGGIVRIGAYFYVLACPTGAAGIGSAYKILKFDADTDTYLFMSAQVLAGSASRPAIGTDGTNLLMAYNGASGNQLTIRTLDPSFVADGAVAVVASRAAAVGVWGSSDITAVNGVVLGGSMRFIASSPNGHFAYDLTSSTVITRNVAYEWPAAAPGAIWGVDYNGSHFLTMTKAYFIDYTNLSGQWDFAFSWFDNDPAGNGTAETAPSDVKTLSPTKFAKWTVSLPSAPPDDGTTDGANAAKIYAAPHGSPLVLQTTLPEGYVAQSYDSLSLTGDPAKVSNEFADRPGAVGYITTPAALDANNDPLVLLQGHGPGRVGPLRWGTKGYDLLPHRTIVTTPPAAGSPITLAATPNIEFDGNTEVKVECSWYNLVKSVASDVWVVYLYMDNTGASLAQWLTIVGAANGGSGVLRAFITPPAGFHSFIVKAGRSSGTGTITLGAGTSNPTILSVSPW